MPLDQLVSSGTPRSICRWGEAVLHRPARPVETFDEGLWTLVADMFATNAAADGAGLAAPQVGVDLAVFVYDCDDAHGRRRRGVVCNPVLSLPADPQEATAVEGCLSLPGAAVPVSRPDIAFCRGVDQNGQAVKVVGTGVLARCLQHEADHLAGVVFADHLPPDERRELRRQHRAVADHYPPGWPA